MAAKASSGHESVTNMRVKATVNREKKSVVFVEADAELADVLFSYLTLPMATVINLSRKQPPALTLGCFDNLYRSVGSLESQHFRTPKCQEMLLRPRSGADAYCQYLKINVEKYGPQQQPPPYGLFRCDQSRAAGSSSGKRSSSSVCPNNPTNPYLSYDDRTDVCRCGKKMTLRVPFLCRDVAENGLFVKRLSRLVISDDLQVKPATTAATMSLLSEHSVADATAVEELTVDFGINEALDLLKLALVSKTPLSDVLLNTKVAKTELSSKASFLGGFDHHCHRTVVKQEGDPPPKDSSASGSRIKLVYSKTKNRVLYAEAGEDFVDLIFTFLLVPLGHIFKQMQDRTRTSDVIPSQGCMKNLYKSVQDLVGEGYMVGGKDDRRAPVLLRPVLAAHYGYRDHPLGLKEVEYVAIKDKNAGSSTSFAAPAAVCPVEGSGRSTGVIWPTSCVIKDPKMPAGAALPHDPPAWTEQARVVGYVSPSMYTITDDLNISPVSPASNLALLRKLNVPFSDIEDRIIHVGKQEASRLLMASLTSNSPLTAAFLGCACSEKAQVGGTTSSVDESARPTKRRTRSSDKR